VRPGDDDGPRRFARRWLSFDAREPVRTTLLWRFIAVVAAALAASGLLTLIGN
jgi:hypothetical protein